MRKLFALYIILLCSTANAADCTKTSIGEMPLYPSIFVPRTAEEQSSGAAAANSIPAGHTVLLSIGMSNAKKIWDEFVSVASGDPLKNPDVQVVNGAQGGGSTSKWAIENDSQTWGELDDSLADAGVTKQDVSVIWFVTHNTVGSNNTIEAYSAGLESDAKDVLDLFVDEFPNLKVVWIQPMIYAGYSTASGNYEPYARETGVIAESILANQSWPFFVGYGPYLWADGIVPRDDGLTWLCSDFDDDGNHPGPDGQMKHADYLLQFFHEDSVASIGYLGDGGTLVTVPDVVGLDQATAEAEIESADLTVGTVTTANSDTVAAGNVISQNPLARTNVAPGSAVALVVSLGPSQLTTVPDVEGLDQATAEAEIVSANLTVGTVTTATSNTVLAGNVISQSPSGGSVVATGSAVDLVVSLGPSQSITVPNVVGLDQATAEAEIVSASLVVGTVTSANSDTVPTGDVISQSPSGGASVVTGSAVDLVVSLGPSQLTTVPNVVGLEQTTAEAEIVAANLTVGTVSTASSDTVAAGNVISQSPTGGSLVTSGSAVDLVVSLGSATGVPMIVAPADGSTLSGSSETFTWSAEGADVSKWRLEVGTSPDGRDLFVQTFDGAVTTTLVSGLPTDGSTVYVNLKWRSGSTTMVASYAYTASGDDPPPPAGTPAITLPVPGSILSGASETFVWSAGGTDVSKWRLEVGTFTNGRDLFVQTLDGAVTSTLVSGLPTDGSTVYVNLKWRSGSTTSVASYVYTASGGGG